MNDLILSSDLEIRRIVADVNAMEHEARAKQYSVIEIRYEQGKRLCRIRDLLGHGKWLPWLNAHCRRSSLAMAPSSAREYISFFERLRLVPNTKNIKYEYFQGDKSYTEICRQLGVRGTPKPIPPPDPEPTAEQKRLGQEISDRVDLLPAPAREIEETLTWAVSCPWKMAEDLLRRLEKGKPVTIRFEPTSNCCRGSNLTCSRRYCYLREERRRAGLLPAKPEPLVDRLDQAACLPPPSVTVARQSHPTMSRRMLPNHHWAATSTTRSAGTEKEENVMEAQPERDAKTMRLVARERSKNHAQING